jgi:hypothetical protein
MGSKHLKPILFLLATVLWANFATAQTTAPYLKEVLILNGGQYGNPQEDITLVGYNPFTGATRISDTIHSQSIQALLVEGDFAYIAAEDSLVKIRISDFSRVAAVAFPGTSTYSLYIYYNQLLVGNWYGQADSNLYVFDKTNLTLDYVVPQIEQGVKGIAIIDDTAYLSQNLTDGNYSDSAGYLSLVYMPTGTFVKNVPGDGVSDIAKLQNYAGGIIGIGSATDMASFYDPANGSLGINPIGVDVTGGYGSLLQLVNDTMFGVFDDKIGTINVTNGNIINASLVDTLITSFVYDTLSQNFYVTQTDYFSYTRGIVFNKAGVAIDTFLVGYAPEAMSLVYDINNAPVAVNDTVQLYNIQSLTFSPLLNDSDLDNDSVTITIITQPTEGTALVNGREIEYTATQIGFLGQDSIVYEICDYSAASLCSQATVRINSEWEGVEDLKNLNLAIYPNPANDHLAIRNTGNEEQTLVLTDLAGRNLKTIAAQGNSTTTIDLSNLAPGLYLLLGADGRFTQKVVKQ